MQKKYEEQLLNNRLVLEFNYLTPYQFLLKVMQL